jgi:hypothetical protein
MCTAQLPAGRGPWMARVNLKTQDMQKPPMGAFACLAEAAGGWTRGVLYIGTITGVHGDEERDQYSGEGSGGVSGNGVGSGHGHGAGSRNDSSHVFDKGMGHGLSRADAPKPPEMALHFSHSSCFIFSVPWFGGARRHSRRINRQAKNVVSLPSRRQINRHSSGPERAKSGADVLALRKSAAEIPSIRARIPGRRRTLVSIRYL